MPPLRGVQKLKSNDIRITCESNEELDKLKQVNWNAAYEGLTLHQPKFDVVLHDVPLQFVPLDALNTRDTAKPIMKRIQEQNSDGDPAIAQIRPLRRNFKPYEATKSSSIVIFFYSAEVADRVIRKGLYLNYHLFPAIRYTPQFKVTQCYKCRGFGHHAVRCRRKEACGRRSGEHSTVVCTETIEKCIGCGGNHVAWHPECPRWQEEKRRIEELSQNSSGLFQ